MSQGFYKKYDVRRVDEGHNETEAHKDCDFFVLDLTHDVHALAALRQYRNSMYGIDNALAEALTVILQRYCTCIVPGQFALQCPIHGVGAR